MPENQADPCLGAPPCPPRCPAPVRAKPGDATSRGLPCSQEPSNRLASRAPERRAPAVSAAQGSPWLGLWAPSPPGSPRGPLLGQGLALLAPRPAPAQDTLGSRRLEPSGASVMLGDSLDGAGIQRGPSRPSWVRRGPARGPSVPQAEDPAAPARVLGRSAAVHSGPPLPRPGVLPADDGEERLLGPRRSVGRSLPSHPDSEPLPLGPGLQADRLSPRARQSQTFSKKRKQGTGASHSWSLALAACRRAPAVW